MERTFTDAGNESAQVVCGRNAVLELLKSGQQIDVLYLSSQADEKDYSHLVAMALERGAALKRVHPSKLDRICQGERHQGVAALAPGVQYKSLEEGLQLAAGRGEAPLLVAADGIEDPHNLGAIIRTAECAGAHGLLFSKRGGCGITPAVHRSSAGAASHLPLVRVSNLASAIRELKKAGVFCYCADMDGAYCAEADLTGPIALVVGSEGRGVSRLIKELCDGVVSLPIRGRVNSLNASVAAGALIYEIIRQRLSSEGR